ncbi:MAG TPA: TonB-dependent receptor [Candidatus Acidoferrales bacterium]|nr:TonB-dependent receptor [Candidatus Acidoferrales bacterium]
MFKRIPAALPVVLLILPAFPLAAQNAALVGTVKDQQGGVIPGVTLVLTSLDTNVSQQTLSDSAGSYEFPTVRPATYKLKATQKGFQTYAQTGITLAVDERLRLDVTMQVGETTTVVNVDAQPAAVSTETSSLGSVVENKRIVEIPLNGRFFLDLALLQAGTVVPSTNNRTFLAVPSGIGISGINASGTREDSTNYVVDGMNLSDMVQNQITFQPNIDMIQEFKVQTNAFSAEYGRNAGIVINGVSKSGTNGLHGTAYEFVRNNIFDAKNFFDPPGPIAPFKRNIFGYSVGGPIIKNKTFFFNSYEGRRGREVATINTLVPTPDQRAAATNPVIQKLLTLVPPANDGTGTHFVGTAARQRTLNQETGRIDHNINEKNYLFGSFIINRDERTEPTLQGNNLPGFGDLRPAQRYLIALGYIHVFSPTVTNEFHAGLNRVHITFTQAFNGNPADFGMTSPSSVMPEIEVGSLNSGTPWFGGITGFPQGRGDTTFQYSDTAAWLHGRHSIKFGAEYRRFRNNNFNGGTGGSILFPSLAAFLAATPSQSIETALPVTPALRVNAIGTFVQDDFKISARLTLNLGLRWEYNGVPSEIHDRLSVFDFANRALVRIGTNGIDEAYQKQFTNFGPRVGFAWDPFGKGKTVVRAGAGYYYDQPVTNIVTGLGSNPPFSQSVNITQNINLAAPFNSPPGVGAALQLVDPNFKSGQVLSYNFNIQHEVAGTILQIAYVGSQGRHLRLIGDYNQGIGGVRPISPITSLNASGQPVNQSGGSMTIQESVSNSNYNGMWLSAEKRLAKGLTFNASYTFSKSIDNNSVGSSNPQIQNFYNISAEHGLSDFDARHRFVLSGIYLLPFQWDRNGFTRRLAQGWSVAPIVNLQSGNPFSPIIPTADPSSLETFDRPNVVAGQPLTLPNPAPNLWLNRAAFSLPATGTFGNAGRNILTAPGFEDIDFAISKNTQIKERLSLQFRAEAFNLFNHPNFAQPSNNVLSVNYGQITATRTSRGDLGSSRQLQLGMKLIF